MFFFTSSAKHLAKQIALPWSQIVQKKFSDGEIYLRIPEETAQQILNNPKKSVFILTSTQAPAENILELLFLLDALTRLGAEIHLLFTYFGYARQDRAELGESISAQVISKCLELAPIKTIDIISMHSMRVHNFLNFTNIRPTQLITPLIQNYDCIAAPDKGAQEYVQELAQSNQKTAIFLTKIRPEQEQVQTVTLSNTNLNDQNSIKNIKNKNILIVDDMIVTGTTILKAARLLKSNGAKKVAVYATHGLFTNNAHKLIIESSDIDHLYITNTLHQNYAPTTKQTVLSITSIVQDRATITE